MIKFVKSVTASALASASWSATLTIINPWAFTTVGEALVSITNMIAMRAAADLSRSYMRMAGLIGNKDVGDVVAASADAIYAAMNIAIRSKAAANINKFFTFHISPTTLDRTYTKIRDNKLTGGGMVQDTRGHQLIPFNYTGYVGNLRPLIGRSWQLSVPWLYFALFERFFVNQNADLIFVLNDEAAIGRFDSFRYGLDANSPWSIKYTLNASIYPGGIFNLESGYLSEAFKQISPMAYTNFSGQDTDPAYSGVSVFEQVFGASRKTGVLQ